MKINPALANDKEFLERLATLNNMPYIPEAHKKYNLLPGCTKHGGDVLYYPSSECRKISKLLPEGLDITPYNISYSEYDDQLDRYISDYGMTDGELNELGTMITNYKAQIKKMNVKENWSVLRYIGESYNNIGEFGGFTHGRYYYVAGVNEVDKSVHIIDNEEYDAFPYSPDSANWEIAEDPTGMAAKLLHDDKK